MSERHAYWQLLWAALLALTLAGVGISFYLDRHPDGPETEKEYEKEAYGTGAPGLQE